MAKKIELTESQKKQYNQIAKSMGKKTISTGEQKTASQSFQDQVREKRMAEYDALMKSIKTARENGSRKESATRNTLSRLATMKDTDRAQEIGSILNRKRGDNTSKYYDAYSAPTHSSVKKLRDMGFDVDNINDEWFEKNNWYKKYLKLNDYTNSVKTPGKKASDEEKAAYEIYQLKKANDNTVKAEKEQAELEKYLREQATAEGRTLSDKDIVAGINWKKYPTLAKMREYLENGAPYALTRSVKGSSDDWAYGVLWSAMNGGGTGDDETDQINATLGRGNTWARQQSDKAKKEAEDRAIGRYSNPESWRKLTQDSAYLIGDQGYPGMAYRAKMEYDSIPRDAKLAYGGSIGPDATRKAMNKYALEVQQEQLDAERAYRKEYEEYKEAARIAQGDTSVLDYGTWLGEMHPDVKEALRLTGVQERNVQREENRRNGVGEVWGDYSTYSDEHLEQEKNKLKNDITSIENEISTIWNKQKERDAWQPEYDAWDKLFADYGLDRDYFQEEIRPRVQALNNEIQSGYKIDQNDVSGIFDRIYGDKYFDEITRDMTPEERERFESDIQNAITGLVQQDDGVDYNKEINEWNSRKRFTEGQIQKIEAQQKINSDYQNLITRNDAEGDGKYYEINDIAQPMDFSQVDYGSREGFTAKQQYQAPNADTIYSFINGGTIWKSWGDFTDQVPMGFRNVAQMLPEEIEIFNKYYNAGRKNDAMAFIDGLQTALSQRASYYGDIKLKDIATRYPVLTSAASFIGTVVQPFEFIAGIAGKIFGDDQVNNPNSPYYAVTNFKNKGRQYVAEQMDDIGKFLYNAGMSAGDSFINIMTGNTMGLTGGALEAASLAMFGTQAFQSSMQESLKETGGNWGYSFAEATIDALIETATEIWSVENLLSDPSNFLKYIFKTSFSEASEEFVGSAFGPLVKEMLGHKNEWKERADQILGEGGYTDENGKWVLVDSGEDATRIALREWNHEIFMSTLAGAVSTGGGIFVGGVRNIENRLYGANKSAGRTIRNAETSGSSGQDALINLGLSMKEGSKSANQAQKIQEKLNAGKKVSDFELGKLARNIYQETNKNIGNAAATVIEDRAYEKLEGQDLGGNDRREMAQIIAKAAAGDGIDSLSKADRQKLLGNKAAFNTYNDFVFNKETKTETLGDWVDEVGKQKRTQQSISELLGKPAESVDVGSLEDHLATEEERKNAKSTRDVVVNGEYGQIKGVRNTKDGPVFVVTVNGQDQTFKSHEIKATDLGVATIIRDSVINDGLYKPSANQMDENNNKRFEQYTDILLKAQAEGRVSNISTFLPEAMKVRIAAFTGQAMPATTLDRVTALEIYTNGQKEHGANHKSLLKGANFKGIGKGGATFNGVQYGTKEWDKALGKANLSENVKKQIEADAALAKASGFEIGFKWNTEVAQNKNVRKQLIKSIATERGIEETAVDQKSIEDEARGIYGWEGPEGIVINVEGLDLTRDENGNKTPSGQHHLLVTLGHEMTHWLQRNSLRGYNMLESFVMKELARNGNLNKHIQNKMYALGIDLEEAVAEIVADASDQILGSEQVMNHIKETDQGLFKEIKGFVKDLVGRIKEAIQNIGESSSIEGKVLAQSGNKLAKIWLGAYDEALSGKIVEDMIKEADEHPAERFSMASPIEKREDGLYAVHNMSVKGLMKSVKMGAIPNASYAILPLDQSWTKYGEVSIVTDKLTIDPDLKAVCLYMGDAGTPMLGADFNTIEDAERFMMEQSDRGYDRYLDRSFMYLKKVGTIEEARQKLNKGKQLTNEQKQQLRQEQEARGIALERSIFQFMNERTGGKARYDGYSISKGILLAAERIEQLNLSTFEEKQKMIESQIRSEMTQKGSWSDDYRLTGEDGNKITQEILDFVDYMNETSWSDMVEAKSQIRTDAGRMAAVVMPNTVSEDVISSLEEFGVDRERIHLYEEGNEEDRLRVMNEIKENTQGVRFSRSDYSYNNLLKKPNMQVYMANELSNEQYKKDAEKGRNVFAHEILDEVRKANNGSTVIHNVDTGKDIVLNKDSIKHSFGRKLRWNYDLVCHNIIPILENAIAVNEFKEREDSNYGTLLFGAIDTKDSFIAVRFNVQNRTGKIEDFDILYSIAKDEMKKEGPVNPTPRLPVNSPGTGSPSFEMSIADLVDIVKDSKDFAAVFSKDVARKLGMQRPYDPNISDNLKYSRAQLDSEYQDAVESGDLAHAEEMLLEKLQRTEGIVAFNAPHGYGGQHKDIAKMIKNGTPEVVARAAADMAQYVPENAVLIPMPPHEGTVTESTDTMILARAIGELTGRPVINALGSNERESRYQAKAENRKGVTADEMGFRQIAEIPEGTMPIFIDNVVGSGETAKAARNALGGGITLSYAKSTRSQGIKGLKRATVTYDKDGNLIPLSQRFDISKRDTRYSKAQMDNDYMQAVKDGDTGRQQELVDQAAQDNGYTMKVYHGTPYGGFTQFRDWSYFTQNKEYADRYNHPSQSSTRGRYDAATQPMTYGLYMNPGRVFDTRRPEASKLFNKIRMEMGMSELTERGLPDWTDGRDLIEYIEENNLPYDTIILDEGADGGYGEPVVPRGESYVTRSNMIKSADPVSYDNEGNVIPLSERFNKESNDIRFSMAQPVEQARDLIAVHNLTEQNLLDSLEEGGFTAPSVAIVKAKTGHSKFGPISVIFKKSAIDPMASRKNKIYGTDAWTPTRSNAQIVTKLDYEVLRNARDIIKDLTKSGTAQIWANEAENWINQWLYEDWTRDNLDSMTEKAYNNDGMIAAYKMAKAEQIEEKTEKVQKHQDLREEEVDLYNDFLNKLEEKGMLQEFMEDMNDMSGNEIMEKYSEIFASSNDQAEKAVAAYRKNPDGIARRVVYAKLKKARWFQEDGRQIIATEEVSRPATANYMRESVDKKDFGNWIKGLIGDALGKRGVWNGKDPFTASGNRRSFEATHMEPTAENIVKAMYANHDAKGGEAGGATGLMAKGSKEYRNISEVKADKERLQQLDDNEYRKIVEQLDDELREYTNELSESTGIDMYSIKEILIEAAGKYAASGKTAARNYFRSEGVKITDEQFNRAIEIMDEAREVPTGYFEAKPERVVGFDEIAKVILPEDSSKKLLKGLDNAGIPYELSDGTEEDRLRILNEQEDARFSRVTSESMDVGSWMMGQTAGSVQTEAERQLLQDYRDLRISISLSIKRQLDYKEKIKRLEAREADLTPAERDDLIGLRNKLEIQQQKQADLENKLYKVTAADGWAGMMYHNNIVLNDFILGKTQDQVRESVEQMVDQVKAAEKIIAQQAKALRKMADSKAVRAVSSMINKKTLNYAVKSLKDMTNSAMGKTELESRLTEMALKRANGEDITEDARELATDMTNRMRGYQNDVLERMRGVTITIGPDQQKEMKGNGMTLASVREQLKGTGVKVKYGDFSSLDTDTGDGGDLRTLLPELPQDIGENSGDALFKFISWAQSMRDVDQGMKQQMVDLEDTIASVMALTSTIEVNMNSPEYQKQNQMAAQTKQMAEDLEQAGKTLTDETDLAGKRAVGMASVLQRDVREAIRYYNTIARMAAQEEKTKVKKNVIEQLKSQHTADLIRQRVKYEDMMKKERKMRAIAEDNKVLRNQINTVAKRVRKLIVEETDQKNIPEIAKPLARQMLKMLVQHDYVGYRHVLFADRQQLEKTVKALDSYEQRDGAFDPDRDLQWLVVGSGDVADYDMADRAMQAILDIESGLLEYRTAEGQGQITLLDRKAALRKISHAVSDIYAMIDARRNAEINGRRMLVNEIAIQAEDDMKNSRFKGEWTGKVGHGIAKVKSFVVSGNTTPEYFFKNLRNKTLSQLYDEYHRAENRNGLEVGRAKRRIAEIAEKYGYINWDPEKRYTFNLEKGGTVNLTLGEMMSLYATWERERYNQLEINGPEESFHLKVGGFYTQQEEKAKILGREIIRQKAHRLTEEDMARIKDQMTQEQIAYVDDMVQYMTKDIGALGNEASMRMYGIKKYNEKWYFPFEIWSGVKSMKSDQGAAGNTENRIAHGSFSKRRVNKAGNALVIRDFTETAIKHIGQMINYNTFAPAIEFMNRVMNEQLTNLSDVVQEGDLQRKNMVTVGDTATLRNLRAAFIEAYGREAMSYFDNFQQDINGGVKQADRTIADQLLSTFKKSAVAGSLSVTAQQPLSIIRAAMMISPKYLATSINLGPQLRQIAEEMRKYSGVAVIKDMGKFDMNLGQSAQDYMTPDGMKKKGKAVVDKISDLTTMAPELMDTWTWCNIWEAVKKEQKAQNPGMDIHSDEFLNMVAERFNDVMRKTQVYDSILVKSRNMRSQHWWMKGITSFMSEPTLTLNVLADAVANVKENGGKEKLAKACTTFVISAVMQAIVKGLISAGRTPKDKENFIENAAYRATYSLISELNPLSLIPGYSDLIKVFKDGELTDDAMSVVGNMLNAVKVGKEWIFEGKGDPWKSAEDSIGMLTQLFTNIPLRNLSRDVRAIRNYIMSPYANRQTSAAVLKHQFTDQFMTADNMLGTLNEWFGFYGTENTDYYNRIYQAEKTGKNEKVAELMEYLKLARGTREEKIQEGIRNLYKKDKDLTSEEKLSRQKDWGLKDGSSYIREEYKAGRMDRKTAERLYKEAHPKMTDKQIKNTFDKIDEQKSGKAK